MSNNTPTGNEDALNLIERIANALPWSKENKDTLKHIKAALIRSAQPDNDMRIKVLKEMGFNYEFTVNEDGSVREHIITHDKRPGLFINHTSLICAMERIRIAVDVLARAKMKSQVDGLVKALRDVSHLAKRDEKAYSAHMRGIICEDEAIEIRKIIYEALTQFTAKEKI